MMYQSDLFQVNGDSIKVEAVLQAAQKLSTDEKAELVETLLNKDSALIVVPASSHLADYIIAQMNLLSVEGLSYILEAIAFRIASEDRRCGS